MTKKQEIQQRNHPKKGDVIRVEPIREKRDIATIKKLLADRPADLALFTIGINTNLRAGDLLKIRAAHIRTLKPGESFELIEEKTGKRRGVILNSESVRVLQNLLNSRPHSDDDFIFTGQRGVWSVPYVNSKVKQWCRAINLKGNFGSHTLRKTWGYHQRVTFGSPLEVLVKCFNHATQKQTLDYLCITEAEVREVFLNEI